METVRERWKGLVEQGQAAWPALHLSGDDFLRYLDDRAGADQAAAADLFLACACARGVPGAIETFMRRFDAEIRLAARRWDAAPAFYDEVKQALSEALFVPAGEARIAQYSGRGPLGAWVAVAARRTAGRLRERAPAASAVDEEAMAAATLEVAGDPEFLYLKRRYGEAVRATLIVAFGALAPRDKAMMHLSIVQRLTFAELGRLFGVDQVAVGRWTERVRAEVTAATKRHLSDRLGASPSEVDSLIRMVHSQVEISFSRLLA
jgi:RNA polymerase sigma-70 factor (ECF subfamily)